MQMQSTKELNLTSMSSETADVLAPVLDRTTESFNDDDAIGIRFDNCVLSGKRISYSFAVIDALINEMERHFIANDPLLGTVIACDPRGPSFLSFDLLSEMCNLFPQFQIDKENLRAQCVVGKNLFLDVEGLNTTTADVYTHLLSLEVGFPDLVKCFRFALTLPISSASAERSFSAMRRIKTFLRASMSDKRLSNLALLAIERDISYKLLQDPSKLIDEFVKAGENNKRRLSFQ